MDRDEEQAWLPVIGRALAFLALHRAELGNSDIAVKAEFLEGMGVPRTDVAAMLGSTVGSLGVMLRRRKTSGRKRRAGK